MAATALRRDARGVVIVGAGLAGAGCARALRSGGWNAPITIVGDEGHPPYDRPPLSKAVLSAGNGAELPVLLGIGEARALDIAMVLGTGATRIERAARNVLLSDGTIQPYAALVLATGARPRQLAALSGMGDRVVTLRRFEDAIALRQALLPGRRLLIVGGGLIGLEVASVAVRHACAVTVVEAASSVLQRVVPPVIAEQVLARHRAEGVSVRIATTMTGWHPADDGVVIAFSDGSEARFDTVLVAIGVEPSTGLARAAGLAVDDGILTASDGRTDDHAIFAAGDCRARRSADGTARPVRLENWRSAIEDGETVARALLGEAELPAAPPWFWSDQYDWQLQGIGRFSGVANLTMRRLDDGAAIALGIDDEERLVAAVALGRSELIGREIAGAKALIAAGARLDANTLADPTRRLRDLARQLRASLAAREGAAL